jgi:hypothetical protein
MYVLNTNSVFLRLLCLQFKIGVILLPSRALPVIYPILVPRDFSYTPLHIWLVSYQYGIY